MLDIGCDNMTTFIFQLLRHGDQRPVVGFRTAGGKYDLSRLCVDQRSYPGSGIFQSVLRLRACGINCRSIAEFLCKIWNHLIHYLLLYRRGSGIIEIDLSLFFHLFL